MRWKVAIVGCGVAGATAAILLARDGHDVIVFERTESLGPVGAGILLQPSGQMVLKQIGLLDAVIAQAEPITELEAFTHRGRQLVSLPYSPIFPGCMAYGLHRGDLFAVLHREILKLPILLNLGSTIQSVHDDRLVEFDIVIAADGARSALRQNVSIQKSDYEYSHAAVWAVGNCSAVRGKLRQVTRGTRQLCGLLPTGQGRCSLFWSLDLREKARFLERGFEPWRDEVIALNPPAREIFQTVKSFADTRITGYRHVHLSQFHDGRTVFIGDAAHAMSPHLGQGVNLALVDALCLCESIRHAATCHDAFVKYTTERRRQIRYYSTVTRLLTPFFQSSGFIGGIGRDICLPLLPKLPFLRGMMLRTMAGLKHGWCC